MDQVSRNTAPIADYYQALAVSVPSQGAAGRITLPMTGIAFPRKFSFDRWLAIGRQLALVTSTSAWCLGDWLTYGEAKYTGRYREAIEKTSLNYKTLRNYAWVARRFELGRRREALSFGHHAEVASLPETEQDFWLSKAEREGWSRNRLRRELHASLSGRKVEEGGVPESDPLTPSRIEVTVTATQLELCQKAADQAGVSVEDWVATVIEGAISGQEPRHRDFYLSGHASPQPIAASFSQPPGARGAAYVPDVGIQNSKAQSFARA